MNIEAIRAALGAACNIVVCPDGKRLLGYPNAPGAGDPPMAYPAESTGTFGDTLDGTGSASITMRVLTGIGESSAAQELLDALLADSGPTSVLAALEADPTLAGLCDDLLVNGWSGYQLYDLGGTEYFGAELTVEVLA